MILSQCYDITTVSEDTHYVFSNLLNYLSNKVGFY